MLQFITHNTEKYNTIEGAKLALEGGCRWIQLRMKDSSEDEIFRAGFIIQQLCFKYGATLIIDDHVSICKMLNADGVHLGKNDMCPLEAREILGENKVIGGTANTFDDIVSLVQKGVDYVGLGPFRFTTTKKNLSPILGLDGYIDIIKKCDEANINIPIIAIGGINKEDISEISESGIAGIALSSTILNSDNPVNETIEIIKIIEKYNKKY